MEDIVATIAEQKIREAMRNGEFDNLPGEGKPLQMQDLSHIPEELRAAYIILKNAGLLPEELQLEKDITSMKNQVKSCADETEREKMKKELNNKILRFNIMMDKNKINRAMNQYRNKI